MYLRTAIESLLNQSIQDFECIVVDDASPEPVNVPDDPRLKLVRRENNGGPSAARNTGLDGARGRFLAFLDDDDVFTERRLEIALEGLERAPIAVCWANPRRGRILEGNVYDTILDGMAPHVGRTALEARIAPKFDPRYAAAEDIEWWLRLAREHRVATVPQVGYMFRGASGPRKYTDLRSRIRCRLMLLDEYSGYFTAHPRATAFLWKRVGLMANRLGDQRLARSALLRSLRIRPEAANLWHLARSLRPSVAEASEYALSVGPRR